MAKKEKRMLYEPPKARDLSAYSANGQIGGGVCASGPTPYYSCEVGSQFVGECTNGTTPDTSSCTPGGYHTDPACDPGSYASTICRSGGGQQF